MSGGIRQSPAEAALVALIGLAAGVSSFDNGLYDIGQWGPAGLIVASIVVAAVASRAAALSRQVLIVTAGLALFGLLSLVSVRWADDKSTPVLDGTRWLVLATTTVAFGAVTPTASARRILHGALAAGCAAIGLYVTVRLVAGTSGPLFNNGRLVEPVGYANGLAALLLMGFWLSVGFAERTRSVVLAGGAVFVASAQLGAVVLTETRAIIPAFVLSAVVAVAGAAGRTRRAVLLACCAGTPLIALQAMLDVYDAPKTAAPPDSLTQPAGRMILLGAAVSAIAWLVITRLTTATANRQGWAPGRAARLGGVALTCVAVLGTVGAVAVVGNPVTKLSNGWDDFRSLEKPDPGQSRFASVGGNRYDYWRVAWKQFKEDPLRGTGAGNYKQTYPQLRATSEYVQQAHSIELQALGELGIPGGVALVVLLVGLGWCIVAGLRAPPEMAATGVAGAAALTVWTVQTSIDWLHLLPGVTAVAAGCVAMTVRSTTPRLRLVTTAPAADLRAQLRRTALPVLAMILAVLTGIEAVRMTIADRYRNDARAALREQRPQAALADVARSLGFDPNNADAYYLRSAALARRNDYTGAVAALAVVNDREPQNFLPWVLRGDLAVLRRDRAAAVRSYTRARDLNPQDPAMEENLRRARALR